MRDAETEKGWLDAVQQCAQLYKWRVFHCRDARGSNPGLPDLILVRPPRLLFLELKTTTGRATRDQLEWLADLGQCTQIEAGLFRPTDEEVLFEKLR